MSSIAEKLKRLLALATLREDEKNNESRVNEARTAAFLLVKTCQDNEVRIVFKLKPAPVASAPPRSVQPPTYCDPFADESFFDILRKMRDKMAAEEAARRRGEGVGDYRRADYFKAPNVPNRKSYSPYAVDVDLRGEIPEVKNVRYADGSVDRQGNGVRVIKSKFAGKCNDCQKPYAVGDEVRWRKHHGCVHQTCSFVDERKAQAKAQAGVEDP